MSGGFRDSFTKDDTKEDLLGYDDTAFYYFAISILTLVAAPWTLSVIRSILIPGKTQIDKDFPAKSSNGSTYRYCQTSAMRDKVESRQQKARKCTSRKVLGWALTVLVLILMWIGVFTFAVQLGDEKEIIKFDPFEILGVLPYATAADIKKSYRKLSLQYHPDKNRDDPLAASRFIQISKAYQALTDETAKENFERFGNPDGPQMAKVGIGLPRFLLEKENSLMNLCAFFFVLLFVVPVTFFCYFQRTKNYVANGVMLDTLQFLGFYVHSTTRPKHCPELLAACSESRAMGVRPSDKAQVELLQGQVTEHKRRMFTLPIICKNQCIIWAHMQRKHQHLSPEFRGDCDILLRHSIKTTQAMIEIACMREWFAAAQAMIEFRRCLVQALDIRSSQLLQVPHITTEFLQSNFSRKTPIPTLDEFLKLERSERKTMVGSLSKPQRLDIDEFCRHISDIELKASIAVEDEQEIVVNDIATVSARMTRKNLRDKEAMGPVHSPFFPEPKFEEWWFFLVEAAPTANSRSNTRIVHFERVCDQERVVEVELRFQVTRVGKNNMVLHALCDSYAGIDKKVEVDFHAFSEEEVKREYSIHGEDEDLDLQPTLFQQWMGDLRAEEESEEEEEEEGLAPLRRVARAAMASVATAAKDGKEGDKRPTDSEAAAKAKEDVLAELAKQGLSEETAKQGLDNLMSFVTEAKKAKAHEHCSGKCCSSSSSDSE